MKLPFRSSITLLILLPFFNPNSLGMMPDPSNGSTVFNDAETAYEQGKYLEAFEKYHEASTIFYQEKKKKPWQDCFYGMYDCIKNGNLSTSLDSILAATPKMIWWSDDASKAFIIGYVGFHFLENRDQPEKAIKFYEKASTVAGVDTLSKSEYFYMPLGRCYSNIGEDAKALVIQKACLKTFEDSGRVESLANQYLDIAGTFWDNKNSERALLYANKGILLKEKIKPITYAALMVSKSQYVLELYPNEEDTLKRAYREAESSVATIAPKNGQGISVKATKYLYQSYSIMGGISDALGWLEKAEENYFLAIKTAKTLSNRGRRVAKSDLAYAAFLYRQGRIEESLSYCQHALKRVYPKIDEEAIYSNPVKEEIYLENVFMEALVLKARNFKAKYQSTKDQAFLHHAKAAMDIVLAVEKLFMDAYTYESAQYQMLEESHSRHELLLEILSFMEKEGRKEAPRDMFRIAELSKSILLTQRINELQLENTLEAQRDTLSRLRREINQLKLDKAFEVNSNKNLEISQRLDELLQKEKFFAQALEEKIPGLRFSMGSFIPPVDSIQELLPDEETLLVEYFWGDSSIYVWGIGKNFFAFESISIDKNLKAWEERMLSSMDKESVNRVMEPSYFHQFVSDSKWAYDILLKPLFPPSSIKKLIVIPDGMMNTLPIDFFLTDEVDTSEVNYSLLPYLLNELTIRYEDAAKLLPFSHSLPNSLSVNYSSNYLGISPSYDYSYSQFQPTGNEDVASNIITSLGGELIQDGNAIPKKFIDHLGTEFYKIIHFWGHAKAQQEQDLGSYLAFTQSSEEDDSWKLYDQTLRGLPLNCELFIFTACETGSGKLVKGEGTLHLARATRFGGARNVLLSIWRANSKTSNRLMEVYFKELNNGKGKAEALRIAKLSYIKDEESEILKNMRHPYYWSSFILIGDDTPITFLPPSFLLEIIFLLMGVSIMVYFLFFMLNRKRMKKEG